MLRKKIIILTIAFLVLLIITSIIKNQTRIIEKKLYKLNETVILKEIKTKKRFEFPTTF